MKTQSKISARRLLHVGAALCGMVAAALLTAGCSSGNTITPEQEKQMRMEAAGAKDPSKLSPEAARAKAAFIASMRAKLPSGAPAQPGATTSAQ